MGAAQLRHGSVALVEIRVNRHYVVEGGTFLKLFSWFGLVAAALLAAGMAQAQTGRLLVAQKGDRSLAIVDPAAGKVLAADVAENSTTGHEVAGSADGRLAFVPIYGNSGVGKPGTDGKNIIVVDVADRQGRRQH